VVAAAWPVIALATVTELSQYGLSIAPEEVGAYPILRMMNLVDGQAVENDLRFVDLSPRDFDTYRLEAGDVLFNRTNSIELVGRTGVYRLDGEHVFASYIVRLKLNAERLSPDYLVEYLNAPLGRQQVLSFATKAISQANVSASNLAKVLLPLPPRDIQDRILSDLRKLRVARDEARTRVEHLVAQRRTVLAMLQPKGSQ
jgi:type I restriction enzyme S subunit